MNVYVSALTNVMLILLNLFSEQMVQNQTKIMWRHRQRVMDLINN